MTTTRAIQLRSPAHAGAAWLLGGLLALVALLAVAPPSFGQEAEGGDRTLSPFFFVPQADGTTDRLPLKSTTVGVRVAGVIADVTVTQVYANEGRRALEAIYVFPASTRAAVYAMRMTVGARVIEAQIKERGQARADYEQARQQGRTASLLEQQRPNVFQMNVANILPGDEVKVEMRYAELLVPEGGIYEFVYPTVVGPRYSNKPVAGAADNDRWVATPHLHEGEPPTSAFDIDVTVSAGMPLYRVTCPTHKTSISNDGRSVARVRLDRSERAGGNRDFVLRYSLAGGGVESGLLLSRGEREGFFLLMVQPPERIVPEEMPPREYVFVVDVSGSMHGFPLEVSKVLLRDLLSGLRSGDSFNVLLFAGGSRVLAERSLPATPANVQMAVDAIDRERGGGGTELVPALRRALALPRGSGVSRTIVVATDGFVDIEKDAFELIRSSLDDANLFAFGIGSSVNRFLIEGMARAGMGEPFIVTKPEGAALQAEKFRATVASPALTDIRIDYRGFDTYDVEPPAVGDVFAERPVIVFGKWRGEPRGTVTVSGSSGSGRYRRTFEVAAVRTPRGNEALRYLWARHRIAALGDFNKLDPSDERVREITTLGLTYNLLTDYTSFVAVDTVARNHGGQATTVQQPLPLPEGVTDLAVGKGQPRTNNQGMVVPMALSRSSAPTAVQPAQVPASLAEADGSGVSAEEIQVAAEVPMVDARIKAGASGGVAGGTPGALPARDEAARRQATRPSAVPAEKDKEASCLEAAIKGWRFPTATGRTVLVADLEFAGGHWKLRKVTRADAPRRAVDVETLLRPLAAALTCRPAVGSGTVTVEITVAADGTVLSVLIR